MAKVDEPKDNHKNGNDKKEKRAGKVMGKVLRFSSRTLFILLLILFLAGAGFGLNVVLSSIKDAPEFDPARFDEQPLTSSILHYDGSEAARLHDGHNRIQVPLDAIPLQLQQAFIAIEDERFYDHIGISPKDIVRAAYNNFRKQSLTDQGASTITQQLIKNAILSREKTYERKLQEAWLAIKVEKQYSKEEILELYLNIIYFDYLNYGVEAAAQDYFEKSVTELTLAQSAMLAGIPRNPGYYSPRRNIEESKKRQELVLSEMVKYGYISQREADEARNEEIEIFPPKRNIVADNAYFIDYVELEARTILTQLDIYDDPAIALNRGGLKIYTTLEPEIQNMVEDVLNNEKYYPLTKEDENGKIQPQAAAVLADPETGHIKALVGGRDYGLHNQDLRYLSARQPGSAIKPVLTYAPAFEEKILFPGSVLDDAPTVFGKFIPENFDRTFLGLITVRRALVSSQNIPAVHAYQALTPNVGMEYAKKLGITTFHKDDEGGLALTLGGFTHGVRPIDMAQAYAVFANNGVKVPLTTILRIEDHQGREIYSFKPKPEVVVSEVTAFLITDVLRDVVRASGGTASDLSAVGRPIAAKTGTTSENKDGWLVSYTPDYVLTVWIGYDLMTMGSIRLPNRYTKAMSIEIMKKAHEGLPKRNFESPGGISKVTICSKSGKRPGENCPDEHITSDLFPRGYEPKETCDVHITLEVCAVSGLLPAEYCPDIEVRHFFQRLVPSIITDSRWRGGAGRGPADAGLQPPTEICDLHGERPQAPVGLSLTSSKDGDQVQLKWNFGGSKDSGFNVYRSLDNKKYELLNGDLLSSKNYTDTNVNPGITYYYQVSSVNEHGVESNPMQGSITTNEPPPEPDPEPDLEPNPKPKPKPDTPGEPGDPEEPGTGD